MLCGATRGTSSGEVFPISAMSSSTSSSRIVALAPVLFAERRASNSSMPADATSHNLSSPTLDLAMSRRSPMTALGSPPCHERDLHRGSLPKVASGVRPRCRCNTDSRTGAVIPWRRSAFASREELSPFLSRFLRLVRTAAKSRDYSSIRSNPPNSRPDDPAVSPAPLSLPSWRHVDRFTRRLGTFADPGLGGKARHRARCLASPRLVSQILEGLYEPGLSVLTFGYQRRMRPYFLFASPQSLDGFIDELACTWHLQTSREPQTDGDGERII